MNHRVTTGRSQHGFTLIELLITIVIAAILMAVAIPSFKTMMASSRLSAQTMDLVGAINIARSEAIKRNGTVTLCRVSSNTATACAGAQASWGYWIICSKQNCPVDATLIKRDLVNDYGATIKVTSTFANDRIDFGSDGLARTGSGLVNAVADANYFSICTTRPQNNNNFRKAILGVSSRITTVKASGTC